MTALTQEEFRRLVEALTRRGVHAATVALALAEAGITTKQAGDPD